VVVEYLPQPKAYLACLVGPGEALHFNDGHDSLGSPSEIEVRVACARRQRFKAVRPSEAGESLLRLGVPAQARGQRRRDQPQRDRGARMTWTDQPGGTASSGWAARFDGRAGLDR